MKISKIIADLQEVLETYGDIDGVIEVAGEKGEVFVEPVGELSVDVRDGVGESVMFTI